MIMVEVTDEMMPPEYFYDAWVEYKYVLVDAGVRVVPELPDERCMIQNEVAAHHCVARVLHRLRERAIEWARVYRRGDLLADLTDRPNWSRY